MSLNIAQLQEHITAKFSDVEKVGNSALRFTRKEEGCPFAVYYLDFSQKLPETKEILTEYQDRIIGERFFEGRKSLQWSNYLYFITGAERIGSLKGDQAISLIENDRMYARKFVISEDEIDSKLTPEIPPAEVAVETNILRTWTNLLITAGIDDAILSNAYLPTRLKLIEDLSTEVITTSRPPRLYEEAPPPPFIRSLHLKVFRTIPYQKDFTFGKVNLFFGANASGKTSLLEAIELFYCGRNKRNPDTHDAYELVADFADGCTEIATDTRELRVFRDHNLSWYGKSEIKTNNLYQSFAQFNFLDTDAAVSLATDSSSGQHLEEDLSRLLVGPAAAKTWSDIIRVNDEVASRLREYQPLEYQYKDELTTLEKQLKEISAVRQESDLIREHLIKIINRMGWECTYGDTETFGAKFSGALSELISLVEQAIELSIPYTPISFDTLTKYYVKIQADIEKAETDIDQLALLQQNQDLANKTIKRSREALEHIKEAKHLIDADIPKRTAEKNAKEASISTYSNWLAGFDAGAIGLLSETKIETNVDVYYMAAMQKISDAEVLLASATREYDSFTSLREESINLIQELRQIAKRILLSSPNPDKCPLCHTRFEKGKLSKHIHVQIDEQFEALGQPLLTQLKNRESEMRSASIVKAAAEWLKEFCKRANVPAELPVCSVLAEVENAKIMLAAAQGRLDVLSVELQMLDMQGLSMERLGRIFDQIRQCGYPIDEYTQKAVERLILTINQSMGTSLQNCETDRKEADKLKRRLEKTLGCEDSEIENLRYALSQLKERLVEVQFIQSNLEIFSTAFPWPGGRPFTEILIEAESVRKGTAELQTALSKEMQRQSVCTESIKRKEYLKIQIDELHPKIDRLAKAQSVLETIITKYPLSRVMESALQHNRKGIETIFSQIHSPAEFRGLGSSWTKLVRKQDEDESTLSEISTGQRTAFALSVFLAQNIQLRAGPPVILIDDAIAHIDDLNSLSFLDYLREIALAGKRQIFFTTANEKLASLFERKFDFLGDEFRRIDLKRDL